MATCQGFMDLNSHLILLFYVDDLAVMLYESGNVLEWRVNFCFSWTRLWKSLGERVFNLNFYLFLWFRARVSCLYDGLSSWSALEGCLFSTILILMCELQLEATFWALVALLPFDLLHVSFLPTFSLLKTRNHIIILVFLPFFIYIKIALNYVAWVWVWVLDAGICLGIWSLTAQIWRYGDSAKKDSNNGHRIWHDKRKIN